MRVAVTGGTGTVGSGLVEALQREGHEVLLLSRRARSLPGGVPAAPWPAAAGSGDSGWCRVLEGVDAVVHLAGEPIAARRWTSAQKARILQSRVTGTAVLVEGLQKVQRRPRVLVSASAVGFYGPGGDAEITEDAPPGSDFLARVCVRWEEEAARAEAVGVRVAMVRFGMVLSPRGGALPRLITPYRLFLGGPLGSGRQWVAWIHEGDAVGLIRFLLAREDARGPFNATSPQGVTQRDFSRSLGRCLGRPAWLPVPAVALRLALGEMAETTLLAGQRAVPARALAAGYTFRHPELEGALRAILQRSASR
jgi:uncharacterized protein (TIGR01777 family)